MGYDLHITRADNWAENEGFEITAEEWLEYVKSDPELKLAGYNGPYFALWRGKSEYDPWFDWNEGNICTKNPDDPIIGKMLEIAKKLNAKVQGDDGEVYFGPGSDQYEPKERQPPIPISDNSPEWFSIAFPIACALSFCIGGAGIAWIAIDAATSRTWTDRTTPVIVIGCLISPICLYVGFRNALKVTANLKRYPEVRGKALIFAAIALVVIYFRMRGK